ncbi:myosin heavy chain kinase C-like [Nematostella vectensis]|uniref:myosin heavy chain kinase C-like n=1 Tax=Nematostella vectensis TaxID=45351 RepID=UPI00207799C2|nr:myosin heavy chain kinase C-like [Nematostella vectensis]
MASGSSGKFMAVEIYSYNQSLDTFTPCHSIISVELSPFANGGMRQAHHGYRHSDFQKVVIKRDLQGDNNRTDAENDVRMQHRCQDLASQYNQNPATTKKIKFVEAFLIKFNGGPWAGEFAVMEPFLEGSYVKHSRNVPAGRPMTPRVTPQAFSHFTYDITGGQELVCDIQGVNNDYTDPQIHTNPLTSRYGKGNFGPMGIHIFLKDHHCNSMCKALGLPRTNPSNPDFDFEGGTVPNYFAVLLQRVRMVIR